MPLAAPPGGCFEIVPFKPTADKTKKVKVVLPTVDWGSWTSGTIRGWSFRPCAAWMLGLALLLTLLPTLCAEFVSWVIERSISAWLGLCRSICSAAVMAFAKALLDLGRGLNYCDVSFASQLWQVVNLQHVPAPSIMMDANNTLETASHPHATQPDISFAQMIWVAVLGFVFGRFARNTGGVG